MAVMLMMLGRFGRRHGTALLLNMLLQRKWDGV
jgi:hypothetical protein